MSLSNSLFFNEIILKLEKLTVQFKTVITALFLATLNITVFNIKIFVMAIIVLKRFTAYDFNEHFLI